MNFYGPQELKDGGWHYTHRRDTGTGSIRPLGYCASPPPTTQEEYDEKMGVNCPSNRFDDGWDDPRAEEDKESLRINQIVMERVGHKFHEEPHDTEEEARECYTEYCLDLRASIYSDEDTDFLRWMGASPRDLTEPMEGDDVPPDVKGEECRYEGCEVVVAYPTAIVCGPGLPTKLRLCSEHCSHEGLGEVWQAPINAMGSF